MTITVDLSIVNVKVEWEKIHSLEPPSLSVVVPMYGIVQFHLVPSYKHTVDATLFAKPIPTSNNKANS